MITYSEFKKKHPEANLDDYLQYVENFKEAEKALLE